MFTLQLALAVKPGTIDETNLASTNLVEAGAEIKGFGISLRLYDESGVPDAGSSLMLLRKNEGGNLPAPVLGQLNVLGAQTWKNKVFHVEQAITGSQVSGWPMGFPSIKIPRRFHRMQQGDVWELMIANNTANQLRICGTCIYKWYR